MWASRNGGRLLRGRCAGRTPDPCSRHRHESCEKCASRLGTADLSSRVARPPWPNPWPRIDLHADAPEEIGGHIALGLPDWPLRAHQQDAWFSPLSPPPHPPPPPLPIAP